MGITLYGCQILILDPISADELKIEKQKIQWKIYLIQHIRNTLEALMKQSLNKKFDFLKRCNARHSAQNEPVVQRYMWILEKGIHLKPIYL